MAITGEEGLINPENKNTTTIAERRREREKPGKNFLTRFATVSTYINTRGRDKSIRSLAKARELLKMRNHKFAAITEGTAAV